MFKRLFASALFAGLCAGALAALIQLTFVVPLIQQGELYETGALVHFGAAGSQYGDGAGAGADPATQEHGVGAGNFLMRGVGTFASFLVSYTGFALLLIAGFALADRAGHRVTAQNGAIWGLCGFIVVQLAPGFGLPPDLPGGQRAALELRQVWWVGCAAATAAGLGLLAFGKAPVRVAAGAVIIAVPHLIGAPSAPYGGVAPPELAGLYATRVLGAGAVCWALLGTIAGAVWARTA